MAPTIFAGTRGRTQVLDRGATVDADSTSRTMLSMREPLITATLFSIFVSTRGTAKAIGAIQRLLR